jgi:hypothetical protein
MRAGTGAAGAVAVLLAAVLGGCSSPAPSPGESPPASGALPAAPAIVTFEVADQGSYSIELITDELIAHAAELQAGGEEGRIPSGRIVRDGDGGVNAPWSWHIDPESLEFVDMTTEVCDGLPEYVEDGTLTSDVYCPWSATVVDLRAEG